MKISLLSIPIVSLLLGQVAFATPQGGIVIHNASNNTISAQISHFGTVRLAAYEQKNVSYSALEQACYPNTSYCTAQFYVNNQPAGNAVINAETGKLVNVNLSMRIHTGKSKQILRSVVIQ